MMKIGNYFKGLGYVEYFVMLAEAHKLAGDLEKAVSVNNDLLHIYGGHALSHYELGKLYEELNRPADARSEYEKFLDMWSNADEGIPQLEDARGRLTALKGA